VIIGRAPVQLLGHLDELRLIRDKIMPELT
jgi:hypothetical protein